MSLPNMSPNMSGRQTSLAKICVLQTSKDKHQEVLPIDVSGLKLYTDGTLDSQG